MDEELKKPKVKNPERYKRHMTSRYTARILVWLIALPLSIGIAWPWLKHITRDNALNLFVIVGWIFLFFMFIAYKITTWLMVKLFGDIARVEAEERGAAARGLCV
jgi:hypothetical protein